MDARGSLADAMNECLVSASQHGQRGSVQSRERIAALSHSDPSSLSLEMSEESGEIRFEGF